jgi:hypothetical protein
MKETINEIIDSAGSLPSYGDININLIGIADNPEQIDKVNIANIAHAGKGNQVNILEKSTNLNIVVQRSLKNCLYPS